MIKFSRERIPLEVEAYSDNKIIAAYNTHSQVQMPSVFRHLVAKLIQNELTGTTLLDVGTGTGLLAVEIVKNPLIKHKVIAFDLSENIINTAANHIKSKHLECNIDLLCAAAAEMPFEDKSIDVIVSNASLHHWREPVKVFNEIRRVLSANGFCMIRDNMRLPGICSPIIEIVCACRHIKQEGKQLWENAINASYTVKELKTIVGEAGLHNSNVFINPTFLDLCVTWSPQWEK